MKFVHSQALQGNEIGQIQKSKGYIEMKKPDS